MPLWMRFAGGCATGWHDHTCCAQHKKNNNNKQVCRGTCKGHGSSTVRGTWQGRPQVAQRAPARDTRACVCWLQ